MWFNYTHLPAIANSMSSNSALQLHPTSISTKQMEPVDCRVKTMHSARKPDLWFHAQSQSENIRFNR
jgi:hypothetical protein